MFSQTAEVHDKAVQNVLAAEFETVYAAIAQQTPRIALGWSALASELTRDRVALSRRDPAQRIHVETMESPSPLSRRERGTGGEDWSPQRCARCDPTSKQRPLLLGHARLVRERHGFGLDRAHANPLGEPRDAFRRVEGDAAGRRPERAIGLVLRMARLTTLDNY